MRDLKSHGINTGNRVYVIAELGINHGGDVKTAKGLIDSAAGTGAGLDCAIAPSPGAFGARQWWML